MKQVLFFIVQLCFYYFIISLKYYRNKTTDGLFFSYSYLIILYDNHLPDLIKVYFKNLINKVLSKTPIIDNRLPKFQPLSIIASCDIGKSVLLYFMLHRTVFMNKAQDLEICESKDVMVLIKVSNRRTFYLEQL